MWKSRCCIGAATCDNMNDMTTFTNSVGTGVETRAMLQALRKGYIAVQMLRSH